MHGKGFLILMLCFVALGAAAQDSTKTSLVYLEEGYQERPQRAPRGPRPERGEGGNHHHNNNRNNEEK